MNSITFMTGLLTFYLKGSISVDQNFLHLRCPNTILALIPLGAGQNNIPVNQLSSVGSDFWLNFKRLVVGIIIAIIACSAFSNTIVGGIILLLIAANMIITSFNTVLTISNSSGSHYCVNFLIFEKSKAGEAEQMIQKIINMRLNDTNNRQVTENQTETLVNAINGLK